MKKFSLRSLLVIFLMMFVVGCGGKSTSIEGKLVDGKDQPLKNVKVAAKMSQPIKGYEQFETTTDSDGAFKFKKLFPTSEYQLIFYSDRWTGEKRIKADTGPEGQTKILSPSVKFRFMDIKDGVILDTKMDLMLAELSQALAWRDAKNYCTNYRGGGYTDWRMPTIDELAELCAGKFCPRQSWICSAETPSKDSRSSYISFYTGGMDGNPSPTSGQPCKALPVRSTK